MILDDKRKPFLKLQPSVKKFDIAFEAITDGLLKGLNWSNLFIAGGIVLSTLQCTQLDKDIPKYKNSDIDMYIYGLGPMGANKKVQHVYQTWKSNLPSGAESRVLRNSRTITYIFVSFLAVIHTILIPLCRRFMSEYPTKRIQIVLKLVKHPREVLLNFDLDPCAVGYDGNDVYMLPRAARALESEFHSFSAIAKFLILY